MLPAESLAIAAQRVAQVVERLVHPPRLLGKEVAERDARLRERDLAVGQLDVLLAQLQRAHKRRLGLGEAARLGVERAERVEHIADALVLVEPLVQCERLLQQRHDQVVFRAVLVVDQPRDALHELDLPLFRLQPRLLPLVVGACGHQQLERA